MNKVDNIDALAGMHKMTALSIWDNQVSDISALKDLKELRNLDIRDNKVEDISVVSGMTKLKELELENNCIADISPTAGLDIKWINAKGQKVTVYAKNGRAKNPLRTRGGKHMGAYFLKNMREENDEFVLIDPTKEGSGQFTDNSSHCTFSGTITVKPAPVVDVVKDINLKHKINAHLHREAPYEQPISEEDMKTLTDGAYKKLGIKDLSGMEYAEKLTEISFFNNKIEDISQLKGLKNLSKLDLGLNLISDIKPVAELTNLKLLSLNGNKVSDIKPLAGLADLENLQLRKNGISDISALSGLTKLKHLELDENDISDIGTLAKLTNLESASMTGNKIKDIGQLKGLTNLKKLAIGDNGISDIKDLAGLEDLEGLYLYENEIENINAVANMHDLRNLNLWKNKASDISALKDLKTLEQLDLEDNQIKDISPVAGLTNITELKLKKNFIADMSPAANLKIKWIDAKEQNVVVYAKHGRIDNPLRNRSGETVKATNLKGMKLVGDEFVLDDQRKEGTGTFSDNSANCAFSGTITVKPAKQYSVKVNEGTAAKDSYEEEDFVTITAKDAPEGMAFDKWTVVKGHVELEDVNAPETGFEMPAEDVEVTATFKDANVIPDELFRKELNKGAFLRPSPYMQSITAKDMGTLTYIMLPNKHIGNVDGIEYGTEIKSIQMTGNKVSDVAPIAKLRKVTKLDLGSNSISDASPIAEMKQLKELDLGDNHINDISTFSALKDLESLTLSKNSWLTEIDALSGLTKLKNSVFPRAM